METQRTRERQKHKFKKGGGGHCKDMSATVVSVQVLLLCVLQYQMENRNTEHTGVLMYQGFMHTSVNTNE